MDFMHDDAAVDTAGGIKNWMVSLFLTDLILTRVEFC